MQAQRQMLCAEDRLVVEPKLRDMLHIDVDRADDNMHYHEAVRCVLDL